jgi:hypothetical protein
MISEILHGIRQGYYKSHFGIVSCGEKIVPLYANVGIIYSEKLFLPSKYCCTVQKCPKWPTIYSFYDNKILSIHKSITLYKKNLFIKA